MPKISQYPDGGALQSTDKLVIARSGVNYSIYGSQARSNWNLLYNGGFQVAQRGDGPFTSASAIVNNDDSYLLDGCIFLANGADTCDVSRVQDNDFVSGYKIRLDVETANRRFGVFFPVESFDMRKVKYTGKASFQFKVKCTGTSMSNVRAYLLSWSSTADTITSDPISAWGSAGADPTFVANWTAENTASNLSVSTTIATKTVENITVDTSGVVNLGLLIIVDDTDATVGDFLEIGDVQLEEGEACSEYWLPDIQDTYTRCLRYFEYWDFNTANASFPPLGVALTTTTGLMQVGLFPKRNTSGNALTVGTVGNLRFQGQTLATFVGVPRLQNFMIATISTAGAWTANQAGFLATGVGVTTYIFVSNEL